METAARKLELHKALLISTHLELVFSTDTLVFWFFHADVFGKCRYVQMGSLKYHFMKAFYEARGETQGFFWLGSACTYVIFGFI